MSELFIIRTAIGREAQVMDFLASNSKKMGGVFSLIHPHGVSGYIFVEADGDTSVKHVAHRVPYVRGILRKPVPYSEVEHWIEFKPESINIHVGDIVSVVAGPFKGERAKVTRLNLQKSEVILELLEAAVPIPITINVDSVRVIGKKEQEDDEKE